MSYEMPDDFIEKYLSRSVEPTKSILDTAKEVIYGDREQTYGSPSKNLEVIANFWENYLHAKGLWNTDSAGLTPEDVCHMMVLLKVARLTNTPGHRDSLVDICGYAALVERVQNANGGRDDGTKK